MGTLNPGALLHGLVPAVAVTVGVPLIWTRPLDAEIIGTLKPGADDQGLVAAVAVTVCTLDRVTIPLDNEGAEESVTVPLVMVVAVLVMIPLEIVTISPADEVTTAKPAVEDTGRIS